jgi:signal transduction histidine kinase
VSKAISDLRDLSKSLNPEIIMKIGLTEAVERELLIVAKTGQYEVNLSQEGDYYRFDPQKELIIFRIFQETLNNIINHSRAKTVDVTLGYQPQHFWLTVADDGMGFDISSLECNERCRGLGIQNMRNRAKLIGAEIQFMSVLEKGTAISVDLHFTKAD